MAELKTKPTNQSVEKFLDSKTDASTRSDCNAIIRMMKKATKALPVMWGPSIIGFGKYHYKYPSGQEADWMLTGFSPRTSNISIYIMTGFKRFEPLMKKLGKFKTGSSCLYIKRLSDVDAAVLEELIVLSVKAMKTGNR